MKVLKSKSTKRSLEEFIIKNLDVITNFNSRFEDYLPLSINCLTLLVESKIVRLEGCNVIFNDSDKDHFAATNSLGSRANDIFLANEIVSQLMKIESTSSFYLKLRVVL